MPDVRMKDNESFESIYRRFKRSCGRVNILQEVRKRARHTKPTTVRKLEKQVAESKQRRLTSIEKQVFQKNKRR